MKAYESIPQEALARLEKMGGHIRMARKRRKYTAQRLAELAGTSRETIRRIEQGRPGVSMGYVASALWALQLDDGLDLIAAPERDVHGMALSGGDLPQRVRSTDEDKYDF